MKTYTHCSGTYSPSFYLLFCFLLLVSSSLPSPTLSSSIRCNPDDRKALLRIKNSIKAPEYFDSWILNTDCCNWNGVGCNAYTNRVTELLFFEINTPFQIPSAIGDLPFLDSLDFFGTSNLYGSIPYSITKLQNLKRLRIWKTTWSGPIPEFLSQLRNLEYLDLSRNQLSGSIPASLADLYKLTELDLSWNKLTGNIPDSITKLQNLKRLLIWNTTLSGPIPEFLNQLRNLEYLDLSNNQFSGSIPASLADLYKLTKLDLSWNRLTGNIPDSFGRFKGDSIWLSHNKLSGKIPESFGELDCYGIYLSNNKLVGDASMLFKENGKMHAIDLSWNLFNFDLSRVMFPKPLAYLDLSHNRIGGSIPKEITELDLTLLNVSYNRLCGEIPFGGKVQQFGYDSFSHNRCLCGPPLPKCK